MLCSLLFFKAWISPNFFNFCSGTFNGYRFVSFYITRKRAVEFNKTLIRVSNNGISAIIDELGNIISHIPLNEKRTLAKNINKPENLFNLTYFHNLIFIFLFFISLGALIINLKNNE